MDWDAEVLAALRRGGTGDAEGRLPWEAVYTLYRQLPAERARTLEQALLAMIDLDYRNPHSADGEQETMPLPAGMRPEDLLCLEVAAYVTAAIGLQEAVSRMQALLRAPRFHAVFPHLRCLHLDLPDLLRQMQGHS